MTGVPEGDERSWREARLHLSLLAKCVLYEVAVPNDAVWRPCETSHAAPRCAAAIAAIAAIGAVAATTARADSRSATRIYPHRLEHTRIDSY